MCSSIQNAVNTQLENLSLISLNIIYSNEIKHDFQDFSSLNSGTTDSPEAQILSREKLESISTIVSAMIGINQSASEIKLYTLDGYGVQVGYWHKVFKANIFTLPWYEATLRMNGRKYLSNPLPQDELPSNDGYYDSPYFMSLTRLIKDNAGTPVGIVEVIQDCSTIFDLAIQLEQQNPNTKIYIYNSRHEQVYPYEDIEEASVNYDLLLKKQPADDDRPFITLDASGETMYVASQEIPSYEWNVVVAQSERSITQPLRQFRRSFFATLAIAILLTMSICMYISRQMTKPLLKLTQATSQITINRVLEEKEVDLTSAESDITELSMLCDAIRDMYEKLRSTSQDILLSHNEENRAKLQATQSLINPHFLYNCLTNMSIMAEENMNDNIIKMCHALCDYFRYISSSKDMIVTLEEEIYYTTRYLDCMKLRFNEELDCYLNIDAQTKQLLIPKLIIQPIVENAFKYAFRSTPPWELKISSCLKDENWILEIQDNGGTMTEAKKENLLGLYRNLDWSEELKSFQIGGMGLKNVYLRLHLLYGEKAIFDIRIDDPKHTTFILGGPLYNTMEDYYAEHPQL